MFYFDSNTTVPFQCIALVVWEAYVQWTFADISSDARFNFYKDYFAVLKFFLHHYKTFQMSQYFDWYNSVLQVLIESVKNKRPKY